MRILYLTPYVPSLVRVRPFQMIHALAEHGHDITLVCLAREHEEPQALADLRRWCRDVIPIPTSSSSALLAALRALPTSQPFQVAYGTSKALIKEARQRADHADVVHIEHLRGSSYGAAFMDMPRVLDAVDCISLLFERSLRYSHSLGGRIRALLDLKRTRHAEGRFGQSFDRVVVTSADDAWALRALQAEGAPKPPIDVVPNGVDLAAFAPGPAWKREPATLVFSGKMSYHANETAALYLGREILPLVWRERADARCYIVGRDPPASVRALASDPRIVVTGGVPSVADYLQRATLAVVPLRYGVGIQNKVLEAMATGTPVVATPPAVRALLAEPGIDIAVAPTAQQLAQTILELFDDTSTRASLGEAGRAYVERQHTWPASAGRMIAIYETVATQRFCGPTSKFIPA